MTKLRLRRWRTLLLIALTLIVLMNLRLWHARLRTPAGASEPSVAVLLHHLRECGELVVLELQLDQMIHQQREGRLGAAEVWMLARGDAALAVDLRAADVLRIDATGHRAVIGLPPPRVHRARIDLERSRVMPVRRSGLWAWTPVNPMLDRNLIAQVQRDAQQHLARAAADPSVIDSARRSAERQVDDLATRLGWQVEAQWR